jgi:hypothetical protein
MYKEATASVEADIGTDTKAYPQADDTEPTEAELEAVMREIEAMETPEESDAEDMSLPQVPSHLPDVTKIDSEQEPNVTLPSAPSAAPGTKKRTVTKKEAKPEYTEEEIDSWCVVCNEDSEVECLGCDGDKYCSRCWEASHKGPDAGWDERSHRARYLLDGKGDNGGPRRRLVGAS